MSSLHETAYLRFKSELTDQELRGIYTPTAAENAFARQHRKQRLAQMALLGLLKTTQRLGFVPKLSDIPAPILSHIAKHIGIVNFQRGRLTCYDQSGARQRLIELVRERLGIKAFASEGETLIEQTALQVAETKQELADIINALIEILVRERYELPGFS